MIKVVWITIAVLVSLLVYVNVFAACTGSSPTWNCTTETCPTQTELSACITGATDGDTINMAAGEYTFTEAVTIPEDKTIALIGAGSDQTIISRAGPILLSLSAGSRISGIRFNLTGTGVPPQVTIRNTGWRIDHCYFDNQTGYSREGVIADGTNMDILPEGVIDNNTFNECRIGVYGMGTLAKQSTMWLAANTWGTEHAVYIEDNVITRTGNVNAVDANTGNRYVARYNTINGINVMAHPIQSGQQRATKSWEIYGNKFTLGNEVNRIAFLRGGTGFVFYNRATFYNEAQSNMGSVYFDNDRSDGCEACGSANPDSVICDGNSAWDGNTDGQFGWPCRDQIGRGPDSALFNTTTYAASTSEPAHVWFNWNATGSKTIPVVVSMSGYNTTHIQADRDYFDYVASPTFDGTSGTGCGALSQAQLAATYATCTDNVAYWSTSQNNCSDLTGYVGDATQRTSGIDTKILGTLYKCASNTWTEYYTPYTYPHPLRGESETTYTVTVTNSGSGHSASHDGTRSVLTGGSLNYIATMLNGWKANISGCGCNVSNCTTATCTCTITPTENCEVTATSSEQQVIW